MEQELERVKRYELESSLLLLDVDHFKRINDQFGHGCGDDVLKQLTRLLKDMIRPVDIIGRLGGEEFGMLIPETNHQHAVLLAERIRQEVENMSLKAPDGRDINLTVSIGIDEINKETASINSVLSIADERMYQAKKQGRNQVVNG